MNAQPPVRRLIDDYHFYLARTERLDSDEEDDSPLVALPPSPPSDDPEHLSQFVCSRMFRGTARGHGIVVSYVIDPHGSGAVLFNWRILLDERCEPTLIVLRNGKKFHEASRRLSGEIPDLLTRNERYQFCFGLIVGRRELERPAICELVVPSFKAAEPIESIEVRRARRDAWKREQYAKAERYETDQHKLKAQYAVIDQAALEQFGEL